TLANKRTKLRSKQRKLPAILEKKPMRQKYEPKKPPATLANKRKKQPVTLANKRTMLRSKPKAKLLQWMSKPKILPPILGKELKKLPRDSFNLLLPSKIKFKNPPPKPPTV